MTLNDSMKESQNALNQSFALLLLRGISSAESDHAQRAGNSSLLKAHLKKILWQKF
jgi:hypothetical protein